MQVPLQITMRHIGHSDALEAHIREHAAELARFHPRITSCRVTVDEVEKHRLQGRRFEVALDVRVPGHAPIVATRRHDEDIYVALRDTFAAATRQLEDVAREMRGDVKTHGDVRSGPGAQQ